MVKPHHQYDIDLLKALKEITTACSGTRDTKDKLLQIERHIQTFCTHNGMNFDFQVKNGRPILVQLHHPNYALHLAIFMIAFDVNRMSLMLDWQMRKFGDPGFVNIIEFLSYGYMKAWSPFGNPERDKEIMNWVKANRAAAVAAQSNSSGNQTDPPDGIMLKWNPSFAGKARRISKKLSTGKYTSKPTSFFNAIDKGIPIEWRKDPETLAYLINQLYLKKYIEPTTKNGFRGAAELLFFCAAAQRGAERISVKTALGRINRSPSKYNTAKAFVDSLMKFMKS